MRATVQKMALADTLISELHPLPGFISWNSRLVINMKSITTVIKQGKLWHVTVPHYAINILHEPQNCLENYKSISYETFTVLAQLRIKLSTAFQNHMHHLTGMVLTVTMSIARLLCKMTFQSEKGKMEDDYKRVLLLGQQGSEVIMTHAIWRPQITRQRHTWNSDKQPFLKPLSTTDSYRLTGSELSKAPVVPNCWPETWDLPYLLSSHPQKTFHIGEPLKTSKTKKRS